MEACFSCIRRFLSLRFGAWDWIRLTLTGIFVTGAPMLDAAPQWWSQNWPSGSGYKLLDSNLEANDYAVANIGQLKNAALRAYYYLDSTLPGGAGATVRQRVESFYNLGTGMPIVSSETSDFSVLNQGQLKYILAPFYDRLLESGYITWLMLRDQGAPNWVEPYPWTDTASDDQNFSPVLIGQLKLAFGFVVASSYELEMDPSVDIDGDLIDDQWADYYGLSGHAWYESANSDTMRLYEKYRQRLHPTLLDTDGDGTSDSADGDPRVSALQVFSPAF